MRKLLFVSILMFAGCCDEPENPPCDDVCPADLINQGLAKLQCFDGPGNDRCICQSTIDPLTVCRITCADPGPDGICGTVDDGG